MASQNLDIKQEVYEIENFWKNLITFLQVSKNPVSKKKRELMLLPFRLIFGSPYND
ncbi:hypothetical protein IKQ26_10135 [bacterium]|nr:hypothetical protein [bacterium]